MKRTYSIVLLLAGFGIGLAAGNLGRNTVLAQSSPAKRHILTIYLPNQNVREFKATGVGMVSDSWYFTDSETNKRMQATGTVIDEEE